RIVVTDGGVEVHDLNELEYIHGEIYANIWQTDLIAIISPKDGHVAGWVDLTGLLPASERANSDAVLNGIAFDTTHNRLFVTGKLWPKLFEIRVTRKK
ncbi:MAG: glutaminyl-peptide cyclotransferase, partial [Candidatus Acidiferrales bacterium]